MPNQPHLQLVPVTDRALLTPEGLSKDDGRDPKNWTWHIYDHSETRMTGVGMVVVHLFRCTISKKLRIWGVE